MNFRRQLNVGITGLPGDDLAANPITSLQDADGLRRVSGIGKGPACFLLWK
jgi:hypothetical protein